MIELCPTIAGVRLPFCVMNAAGALSTSREELLALAHSDAGAVVTKSITSASFLDPGATCGIENPGASYYVGLLSELRKIGKPVITSIAGLTVEEFVHTAQTLAAAGADLIEVNLNDPQVHTHLAPFASVANLLRIVSPLRQAVIVPLVIKLSTKVALPLATVTAVVLDAGISAMVCHNTSANGEPSQAHTVLHASQGKLEVIGVGSVSTGAEALKVLQSGVKAIQIASPVMKEGVSAFTRVKRELANSLELRA